MARKSMPMHQSPLTSARVNKGRLVSKTEIEDNRRRLAEKIANSRPESAIVVPPGVKDLRKADTTWAHLFPIDASKKIQEEFNRRNGNVSVEHGTPRSRVSIELLQGIHADYMSDPALTIRDMAQKWGVPYATLQKRWRKMGLQVRRSVPRERAVSEEEIRAWHEEYVRGGKTLAAIAKEHHIAAARLSEEFEILGLPVFKGKLKVAASKNALDETDSQLEETVQEQPSPVIMTEPETLPNEAATKELVAVPHPKSGGMCVDIEGVLPLTVEKMLGWAVAILGIRGGGKSNTAAVVAEELLSAGLPLMVVDIAGEYHTLRDEFSHVTVIGQSLTCAVDIEADEGNARALAEKMYTHGESVIFDLSAVPSDQRAELLNEFFGTVWELSPLHRIPYFIFLEEAQNWIPQRGKTAVSQLFRDMASEGRKRGLSLVMVSLRSAGLDKAVLSQADLLFLHRVRHPVDMTVYVGLIPRPKRWVEEKVNKLKKGQALVLIGDEVIAANIRLRRTRHVGYTPTLANVPIGSAVNGDPSKATAVAMLEPETSPNSAADLSDVKVREIYAEYIATNVTVEELARKHNSDTATLARLFAKVVHSRKGAALSLSDDKVREIYAEYIASDQTINEVAEKHNTNTATLARRFAALSLKARPKGGVGRLPDDTIRAIHAEHIATGLSAGKLGEKYHVSRPTLVARFRDLGLEYPWRGGECEAAEVAPERIAVVDTRPLSEPPAITAVPLDSNGIHAETARQMLAEAAVNDEAEAIGTQIRGASMLDEQIPAPDDYQPEPPTRKTFKPNGNGRIPEEVRAETHGWAGAFRTAEEMAQGVGAPTPLATVLGGDTVSPPKTILPKGIEESKPTHDILTLLLDKLPPNRCWTPNEKGKWLKALEAVLDLEIKIVIGEGIDD